MATNKRSPYVTIYWVAGGKTTLVNRTGDQILNGFYNLISQKSGIPRAALPTYKVSGGTVTMSPAKEPLLLTISVPIKDIEDEFFKLAASSATIKPLADELRKELRKMLRTVMIDEYRKGYGKYITTYFTRKWPKDMPLGLGKEPGDSMSDKIETVDLNTDMEEDGDGGNEGKKVAAAKDDDWDWKALGKNRGAGGSLRNKYNLIRDQLVNVPSADSGLAFVSEDKAKRIKISLGGPTFGDLSVNPKYDLSSTKTAFKSAFLILELGTGHRARPVIVPFSSPAQTPYKVPHSLPGVKPGMWSSLLHIARYTQKQAGYAFDKGTTVAKFDRRGVDERKLSKSFKIKHLLILRFIRHGRRGIHSIFSPNGISAYAGGFLVARKRLFNHVQKEVPKKMRDKVDLVVEIFEKRLRTQANQLVKSRGQNITAQDRKSIESFVEESVQSLKSVAAKFSTKSITIKITLDNKKKTPPPKNQKVKAKVKTKKSKPTKKRL